ncbi:MAG: glycosyltransferase family 2 protein [Chitinophagaceae bacterium]|nr:glycosyltransferase family 2 protein [Chitinophagaceae bacterium]
MQRDQFPFISIITLNYNQTDATCAFLESTRRLSYPAYEILVCDMASASDPTEKIRKGNFPHTRLLKSKKNLGFAGGNNWGMRQAQGEYIFIVNNDTEVTPDLLQKLIAPFSKDPEIGVTCPKIKYYSRPNTIQYAGFNPMNNYTGRTTSIGLMEEDKGQYNKSRITSAAHGCAMMVKREILERVGMFAEKFFLYYEEWDWCARITRANYKIWYTADAEIYHKESLTVGKSNPIKVYYHTRNRILYMRRNSNVFQFTIFTLMFIFFVVPKTMATYFIKKEHIQLRYFIKGILWNLRSTSSSQI